jgi:hypothetical protein
MKRAVLWVVPLVLGLLLVGFVGPSDSAHAATQATSSGSSGLGTAYASQLYEGVTPSDTWHLSPVTLTGTIPLSQKGALNGVNLSSGQLTLSAMAFQFYLLCPANLNGPQCPVSPTFTGNLTSGESLSGTCSGTFGSLPMSSAFQFQIALLCSGSTASGQSVNLDLTVDGDGSPDTGTGVVGTPFAGIYTASS